MTYTKETLLPSECWARIGGRALTMLMSEKNAMLQSGSSQASESGHDDYDVTAAALMYPASAIVLA